MFIFNNVVSKPYRYARKVSDMVSVNLCFPVSKPYRYARKCDKNFTNMRFFKVSKPYRYARKKKFFKVVQDDGQGFKTL